MSIDSENILDEMDRLTPVSDSPEFQLHEFDSAEEAVLMDSDCETSAEESQIESAGLTGYELVADMMRRQDAVIAEIDDLNARIELTIKDITDARRLEEAALEVVIADENATSDHFVVTAELTRPIPKAA